jgi:beta-carotene/zeaxanthin 4-ketolase
MKFTFRELTNGKALVVAITTIGIWSLSFWKCMQIQSETWQLLELILLIGWQTWIFTGLFITAHDAMHGSISNSLKLNTLIGQLCLWLYAGFDYSQLLAKHQLHHKYPASDRDPDFHDGKDHHFLGWYKYFICEHISWRQLIVLAIIVGIYTIGCKFSIINLAIFWAIPALLSSLQLFYFGTFLPHQEPQSGYTNPHRAQTIVRSAWWSLITCYHFGYHQEHHESPQIPWWQLYRLD